MACGSAFLAFRQAEERSSIYRSRP